MSYVLVMVASGALGALALRYPIADSKAETWAYRLLVGLCACAVIALVFGSYSLSLAQSVLAVIALAGLVWAARSYRRRGLARLPSEAGKAFQGWFDYVCVGVVAAALLLALISALAPVTDQDACAAHLALPADYAREGHIYLNPGNPYSAYPHLMHCLYAVTYYNGGEKPVALLNWTLAVLACCAVYGLGRRACGPRCGLIAAALLATAPIFLHQAGAVSIDLAFAALATAALTNLIAWRDERDPSQIMLSALLAGSACGIRHTGYLVCAFLGAAVFFAATRYPTATVNRCRSPFLLFTTRRPDLPFRERLGTGLKFVGLFGVVAMLAASPWLLRSAALVGNPVFPFFLGLFPAHAIDHGAITRLGTHPSVAATGGLGLKYLLRFPWDLIMRPSWYDGWAMSPGGMILALGIPGFLIGGRRVRGLAAYSIAGVVCFFFFQRTARYLLPFFIPMMVVAAVAAVRLKALRKGIIALLLAAFAYGLLLDAATVYAKVPVVLGLQTREAYLEAHFERYAAFAFANRRLTGGVILTVDPRSYHLDVPVYHNHWTLMKMRGWPAEKQRAWLREHRIKYIMLPLRFIQESGPVLRSLMPMFDAWRSDTEHFKRLEAPEIPSRHDAGFERVEIYECVTP